MANFLKKMVNKSRARSSSPVKQSNNEFNQFTSMPYANHNDHHPSFFPSSHNQPSPPSHSFNQQNGHYYPMFHYVNNTLNHDQDFNVDPRHDPSKLRPPRPAPAPSSPAISNGSTLFAMPSFDQPQHRFPPRPVPAPNSPAISNGSTLFAMPSFDTATWTTNSRRTSDNNSDTRHQLDSTRPRSISPQKSSPAIDRKEKDKIGKKSRSKSPPKRLRSSPTSTIADYLLPQCRSEGCRAVIIVKETKFLVCKHQLSHASDYFRSLFIGNSAIPVPGARMNSQNEFVIVVSGLSYPSSSVQFRWFIECTIPTPVLRDITDENLETCMRLSKRFRAPGLELRSTKYIQDNVHLRPPMVALCWLNWVLKHGFQSAHDVCLPCVARLSLHQLEQNRRLISERLLADLLAVKLRTCYDQAVDVFQTIHKMDHFIVDLDRCPRCGRHKEQGKVRVQISPCRKLIGCERCMKELGCELEDKAKADRLQAFYQCPHGLVAFSDHSDDCFCQRKLLNSHIKAGSFNPPMSSTSPPPPPRILTPNNALGSMTTMTMTTGAAQDSGPDS